MTLLKLIAEYDEEQRFRIVALEKEVAQLKAKYNELLGLTVKGIREREAATLELIASGALRKPNNNGCTDGEVEEK